MHHKVNRVTILIYNFNLIFQSSVMQYRLVLEQMLVCSYM